MRNFKTAFKKPSGCSLALWIISGIVLILSLFFWIGFPFVYKAFVYSEIKLVEHEDGQLSRTTFLWSKPPLRTLMKFYFFNVTNPDTVMFRSEKPSLIEVGPFSFWEIEDKKQYKFSDDGTKVWYKNYKTFIFSPENSCDYCSYDYNISMPNLPMLGALQDLTSPKYNVSYWQQVLFGLGVMLLGEEPFVEVPVGKLLFDGYDDALLSAAHSELAKIINHILNVESFIPVPVPEMKRLAFFYQYNQTNDEEYWIETGKEDRNKIGKIISWANRTELPAEWYTTPQARMLNGTDSGSFSHPDLKKTDKLEFFLSFFCRSFSLEFSNEAEVDGVNTYEFRGPPESFDTTIRENLGFRYPNYEKVNYAKGWPMCFPTNSTVNCTEINVDCRFRENFCHSCCEGSYYNGTYIMPPGIYPVECYPGKLKATPFTVQFSPPHFAFSPPALVDGVRGLRPKLPEHVPFIYKYEPFSGTTTQATFQLMVSTPIYNISEYISTRSLPQAMTPFVWFTATGNLRKNTADFVKLGFSTVPTVAFVVKISTIVVALILALFALCVNYLECRRKALLDHLFSTYRKELRPVKNENSGPTVVTVQFYFKQIQKIQESDQILTVYCWLEEYWLDEFLKWDPDQFGGIKQIHIPADMIWKPDLLVYNNANMNVRENELQTNALIQFDGQVSLFRAVITDVSCQLSLQRFPFDQQICYIMLASWSYSGAEIMLNVAGPNLTNLSSMTAATAATDLVDQARTSLRHYIPNMEWRLTDFKYRINMKYYSCCESPYPDISYFFAIKRNPNYYLFTLIVPSAFITIVTVVGFFTPHSSTGENTEKVSLGVTALLSLAIILMMVSDALPATSDNVPLLGQYYVGLIMIMFLATYCTTWTLGIQMQGNAGKAIPKRVRNWILHWNSKNCVINFLFGRELRNSQISIRMRLQKYDRLTALKRQFASDFMQFQQRLFCAQVKDKNQAMIAPRDSTVSNIGSNGSIPLIDADEEIENRNQKHTCESKAFDGSDKVINSLLAEVLSSVKGIRQDLLADEHLKTIRNEWQMLARMMEKILMVIFVLFTFSFACFMLYDDQENPTVTEEIMNQKTMT